MMADKKPSGGGFDSLKEDPDQTMLLGAGAILLIAGVLLFVLIRKRKARQDIDFNTATHTQIE
jgi:LPXTG-motif cell wall-anchored protein